MANVARPSLARRPTGLPVFGSPFRGAFALIACAGMIAAVLIFFENAALENLTVAVTGSSATPRFAFPVHSILGLALLFVCFRIVYRVDIFLEKTLASRIEDGTRRQLESLALDRLARMRSGQGRPTELIHAVLPEVDRVVARRIAAGLILVCLPLAVSDITYLSIASWPVGILAVATAGLSVTWSLLGARRNSRLDGLMVGAETRVRGRLEELLRAGPELEVHGAVRSAVGDLARRQRERSTAHASRQRWSSLLKATDSITAAAALALLVVAAASERLPSKGVQVAVLVPVLVRTLPRLFEMAGVLAEAIAILRRGSASVERLRSLFGQGPEQEGGLVADPGAKPTLEIRRAGYRHAASKGVEAIELSIPPGSWVALVGPSGSGKSTLIDLILGRVAPQIGEVVVCGCPPSRLHPRSRAAVFTYMPQAVTLVEGSIEENLILGSGRSTLSLDEPTLDLLEKAGLAGLCRRWGLGLRPTRSRGDRRVDTSLDGAREAIRRELSAAGIHWTPFTAERPCSDPWVAEVVCGARLARAQAAELLLSPRTRRRLARYSSTPVGTRLENHGRRVVGSGPECATENTSAPMTSGPEVEPLQYLRQIAWSAPTVMDLIFVSLMSPAPDEGILAQRDGSDPFVRRLRRILARARMPLIPTGLDPAMTWRENLLRGVVSGDSQARERGDEVIDSAAAGSSAGTALLRAGLSSPVGREGSLLSGGQRQLIGICRALLRGTPVVVLDEPTSALDPASRGRIGALLHSWKDGRIVIIVTHDSELARAADRFVQLKDGFVARQGPGEGYAPAPLTGP